MVTSNALDSSAYAPAAGPRFFIFPSKFFYGIFFFFTNANANGCLSPQYIKKVLPTSTNSTPRDGGGSTCDDCEENGEVGDSETDVEGDDSEEDGEDEGDEGCYDCDSAVCPSSGRCTNCPELSYVCPGTGQCLDPDAWFWLQNTPLRASSSFPSWRTA